MYESSRENWPIVASLLANKMWHNQILSNKKCLLMKLPCSEDMSSYFLCDITIEFSFVSTDALVAHFLMRIWPIQNSE